jgi:hypothetical protein
MQTGMALPLHLMKMLRMAAQQQQARWKAYLAPWLGR